MYDTLEDLELILLVDMDGVLCDLEGEFYSRWAERHPKRELVPAEIRKEFYIERSHAHDWHSDIFSILDEHGFYAALPPMEGAIETMKELNEMDGIHVAICTSPSVSNPTCMDDKWGWVKRHLGEDWQHQIIITKDKTLAYGHFLLDDRPEITGANPHPMWERLVFDHPYNVDTPGIRCFSWEHVKSLVDWLLEYEDVD